MSHSWLSCCLLLALAPGEPFLDLSYEQALARSKDEGKLLVADFTATWCPPCKKMEKDTWPAESVRAWLAEHALAIQIDVDEQGELARSLKIEALPTVIAFKGGEEFDRIVSYKDPQALLAWLGDVAAGKRAADRLQEKSLALESSEDVKARLDLARELLQHGDHERALLEYLWLWPNSREAPSYAGVRVSFMLSDIRRLCDAYEPAREAFTTILDELDAVVNAGQASWQDWMEWVSMSGYLEDGKRVVAYYEAHRDEQGRLEWPPGLSDHTRDYMTDRVFVLLTEQRRFLDAARLVPDLAQKARDALESARDSARMQEQMFGDDDERLAMMREMDRRQLADSLGRLHVAALMVDRRGVASAIGQMLLDEHDDAESRLALVRLAVQVERAGPEHREWLDQAEALGADVSELRAQLSPAAGVTAEPVAEPAPAAPPDDGG